jgi:hypothetical protein
MRFADGMAEIARLFELQARRARHRFDVAAPRHAARGGARRREAAAPDPHQPAGQCGEVHRARAGHLAVRYQREMARFEIERHRPRHERATSSSACSSPSSAARRRRHAAPAAPAWA